MHDALLLAATGFFRGDPKRIQHFYKVHAFAALIGREEALDTETQTILEAAAIVHDVGIRVAEEKFGYQNGKLQEEYGPAAARALLEECGYPEAQIQRVCWLVGHHHTYTDIDSADYRILVEADFLVNLFEDGSPLDTVRSAYEQIFRTESARRLCRTMFGLEEAEN